MPRKPGGHIRSDGRGWFADVAAGQPRGAERSSALVRGPERPGRRRGADDR